MSYRAEPKLNLVRLTKPPKYYIVKLCLIISDESPWDSKTSDDIFLYKFFDLLLDDRC